MKIMVIHGPNLNMLGIREKGVYGSRSLDDLCRDLKQEGEKRGHTLDFYQSNSEGALIDAIHRAYFERYDGLVINPGAYTHYSYAIYDRAQGHRPHPGGGGAPVRHPRERGIPQGIGYRAGLHRADCRPWGGGLRHGA